MTVANMFALGGAIFFVTTLLMRTMVPLRVAGIISDVFFIGYGVLSATVTTLMLYLLLLPINIFRLMQMLKLVKKARATAQGDLSMDWLKPFMTRRKYAKGDVLFRKGDRANEMFFTVTGKFLVTELSIELPPGRLVGELAFLSPDNRRTQSLECVERSGVPRRLGAQRPLVRRDDGDHGVPGPAGRPARLPAAGAAVHPLAGLPG